jgi:hypothetical protein
MIKLFLFCERQIESPVKPVWSEVRAGFGTCFGLDQGLGGKIHSAGLQLRDKQGPLLAGVWIGPRVGEKGLVLLAGFPEGWG